MSLAENIFRANRLKANTLQAIDGTLLGVCIPTGYTSSVNTVGENIAAVREDIGLAQAKLADRLGVRQPSVWKLENSKGLPNCRTLFKIAVALGCSIERLVAGVNAEYDAVIEPARIAELAREVARKYKPPQQNRQSKKKSVR